MLSASVTPQTGRRVLATLATALGLAMTTTFRPVVSGQSICPFALVTEHACPLCGGTRAFAALIRGDIGEAWAMHPIIFVVLPLLTWAAAVWASNGRLPAPTARTVNRIFAVLAAMSVLLWVVRWTQGTLPPI